MVGERKAARSVAALIGLGLVASACRTDREVTRPDPVPVSEERLTEALLTETDVPGAFALGGEAPPADVVPEHECDDALTELEPDETASVTFTDGGATLTNTISWYPGRGEAVGRAYRDLDEDCEQAVVTGEDLSFTTQALDFGVLSDDTLPLTFVLERGDGTIEERNVIVLRAGDLVSTIRLEGPRPSDKELMDAVVRVAIGRLGLLDEDT